MLNIAILGSGNGSNCQAIIDAINDSKLNANISCIISDVKDAYIYSCKKDIEAIKPGNVNLISPDNDTTADDYIRSCILSSKKLFIMDYCLIVESCI